MDDSGATAEGFISDSYAQKHDIPLIKLKRPRRLNVVDGRPSTVGNVTHKVAVKLSFDHHAEEIELFVTRLANYDVILGKPWMAKHNPLINWTTNTLCFDKLYCQKHCLTANCSSQTVHGIDKNVGITPDEVKGPLPRRIGAASFTTLASKREVEVFSLSLYEVDKRLEALGCLNLDAPKQSETKPTRFSDVRGALDKMREQLYACELNAEPLDDTRKLAAELHCSGASLEDIQKALEPKTFIDPRTKLPEHYHEFLPVFDQREADKLPPHRDCDHKIELLPGKTAPAGPLYNMSEDELKVLRKFLRENLDKGFIRASSSPAASPVLFARKPGGGLRFCVDYRALNAITIKNRYPLPLIRETLAQLSKAKIYTKLDVVAAFNRIRIAKGDEWLTAFNTRYGLFETLVMPFGLSNAPATFQARINEVLHPFLDVFCTAYIDDILIYSNDLKIHRQHVRLVLQALQEAGLQLDIKKCEFEVTEVAYLGMIISTSGVKMDPKKVQCIVDWEDPKDLKDVQAFLGFANFYRRFIKNFSRIARPLVALTKKNAKFDWSRACSNAFSKLKNAFISAPVLRHFDPSREIFVEVDASDHVSAAVLSQKDDGGTLHPVAFMSKKHEPAECNYEIYDKELLSIVQCFECWRPELQGSAYPIQVLTDHQNLVYFMTTKQLSQRQVRWSEFLSQFDFIIKHRPGAQNKKPDALTRRSQDLPSSDDDVRVKFRNQTLLHPSQVDPAILTELKSQGFLPLDFEAELQASPIVASDDDVEEPTDHKILRLLDEGYKTDKWWLKIEQEMTKTDGIPRSKDVSLAECEIKDSKLYFRDRLYVPDTELRPLLLRLAHDSTETGHPGKNKLYAVLSQNYCGQTLVTT